MSQGPVRYCPGCGQALRFPSHIGGMLMACPVCGHRFASPFRLAGPSSVPPVPPVPLTASLRPAPRPDTVPTPAPAPAPSAADTLPEATPRPPAPTNPKPGRETTLAAKVAAKYAAKS